MEQFNEISVIAVHRRFDGRSLSDSASDIGIGAVTQQHLHCLAVVLLNVMEQGGPSVLVVMVDVVHSVMAKQPNQRLLIPNVTEHVVVAQRPAIHHKLRQIKVAVVQCGGNKVNVRSVDRQELRRRNDIETGPRWRRCWFGSTAIPVVISSEDIDALSGHFDTETDQMLNARGQIQRVQSDIVLEQQINDSVIGSHSMHWWNQIGHFGTT